VSQKFADIDDQSSRGSIRRSRSTRRASPLDCSDR
jgi:hypothetical protein